MIKAIACCLFSITPLVLLLIIAQPLAAQELTPIPVQLKQQDGKWQLFRGGQPYLVKGAGGLGPLKLLSECGGNSIRTWGVGPDTKQLLDDAHANGISVAVGIWLEHSSRGYDYQDYQQVNEQIEKVLQAVRKYKDHPAVLLWGVGNEMEGYQSGDNPAIWHHVEHLCRLIKQEDPNHPTMTVIAEIGGNRIEAIDKFCPSVDIIGVNSYGGAASLPKRYSQADGSKPYIVTEFGPLGPWELGRNKLEAVDEATSNVKAKQYQSAYQGIVADRKTCLGSYAFLWGQKMEATATWFGMLLQDGRKTSVVETMSSLWAGKEPSNTGPQIDSLNVSGSNVVQADETLRFEIKAASNNGPLKVEWSLLPEAKAYITAGDFRETPENISDQFVSRSEQAAELRAPNRPGLYRLYAVVSNDSDFVATANVSFRVKPSVASEGSYKPAMPFVIHDDKTDGSYFQLEYQPMPTRKINFAHTDDAKFGKNCIHFSYQANSEPDTISWNFANSNHKSIDISDAIRVAVWARGARGGETITVEAGRNELNTDNEILLTKYWKKFFVEVENLDVSGIRRCFSITTKAGDEPVEFFIDRIVAEQTID